MHLMQIESETEKARKRAERFGAEFTEPNVELILDPDELRLYYKITQPEKVQPAGSRRQYRSQVDSRFSYTHARCIQGGRFSLYELHDAHQLMYAKGRSIIVVGRASQDAD